MGVAEVSIEKILRQAGKDPQKATRREMKLRPKKEL